MAGLIGLLDYLDRRSGREQYGNLLNEYRQPGDPNQLPLGNTPAELDQSIQRQQGGFRGDGGVLSGGPPSEFYLRAAALPGYQQLAQQAQVGQQAMERQAASQQWQQENMTAGQRAQLEVTQQQQLWERERRDFEWNNPSVVQQASMAAQQASTAQGWGQLGVSQGNQRINQAEFNARYIPDPQRPGSFMPRPVAPQAPAGYTYAMDPVTNQPMLQPIRGGAPWVAQEQQTGVLQDTINTLGDIRNEVNTTGTRGIQMLSGDTKASQQAFSNAARAVITRQVMGTRTDAPNQTDLEAIESQIADISKLFGKDETRSKAITLLMDTANQQRPPGTPAIGYKPGQSAYFKNYRSQTGRSKLPEGEPFSFGSP